MAVPSKNMLKYTAAKGNQWLSTNTDNVKIIKAKRADILLKLRVGERASLSQAFIIEYTLKISLQTFLV